MKAKLAFLFGMLPALVYAEVTVTGQCFIVTRDRENVKLGLVAVSVFDERDVSKAIIHSDAEAAGDLNNIAETAQALQAPEERLTKMIRTLEIERNTSSIRSERYQPALDARAKMLSLIEELKAYSSYLRSAGRYFDQLPAPLSTVKTDADGRFAITVPPDVPIVVGASANRQMSDGAESYHWLMRVIPAKQVILSNDNLTSVHSADSILQTAEERGRKSSQEAIEQKVVELNSDLEKVGSTFSVRFARRLPAERPAEAAPVSFIALREPVKVRVKYGEVTLPAGMRLRVIARDGSVVTVAHNNDTVRIPVSAIAED